MTGTRPSAQEKPLGARSLKDYPEVAVAIVQFISEFTVLEFNLHALASQMLGDGQGLAHIFLSRWNSFSNKLEIICEIASRSNLDNHASRAILDNKRSLEKLHEFRNMLAHSILGINQRGVVAMSYMSSNRKDKDTPLSFEFMNEKLNLLESMMIVFRDVLRPGRVR